MFKKILFVLLLAAAVVAFAGYSVPTASACSTGGNDECGVIFGSSFDASQTVPQSGTGVAASTFALPSAGDYGIAQGHLDDGLNVSDSIFPQ